MIEASDIDDDLEYERRDDYFDALSTLRRLDGDALLIIIERLALQLLKTQQALKSVGVASIIRAPDVSDVFDGASQEQVDAMRYAVSLMTHDEAT